MMAESRPTVVRDVARHASDAPRGDQDWFAQDVHGNVCYLGEDRAYDANGHVDPSGSWEAGVSGVVPGIIMVADPQVPDSYPGFSRARPRTPRGSAARRLVGCLWPFTTC